MYFILGVLALTVDIVSGYTVEYMNVTSNWTNVNVTTCAGSMEYTIGIFRENLTWSQAKVSCEMNGYHNMDKTHPTWPRRMHTREFLEKENVGLETYWTDFRRQYSNSSEWCPQSLQTNRLIGVDEMLYPPSDKEMCLAMVFNMSEDISSAVNAVPGNCFDKKYYTCERWNGYGIFHVFDHYDMNLAPDYIKTELVNASSMDSCIELCYNESRCTALLYRNDSMECKHLSVETGYATASWSLIAKNETVLFAGKGGCFLISHNSSLFDPIAFNDSYYVEPNECYTETTLVPSTTTLAPDCICPNTTISDEELEGIINELMVEKVHTSYHRRRRSSAEDHRPGAKTVGALGIAITVTVLALPIVSDIITLIQFLQSRQLKMQLRQAKKEKRQQLLRTIQMTDGTCIEDI